MTPAALRVGDHLSFRKTLTVAEQAMYTGISGNMAPLHVDRRAAAEAGFAQALAFELIAVALATTALDRLAGPGWRLGGLAIDFTRPVLVGETIESRVEVLEATATRAAFDVRCTNADGEVTVRGTATLVPVHAARPRD